ncbi:MAG: hypothetical protein LBH13_06570 [Cellulomonadaceae bacterium]|jgi:hypothetical protein|nr:hypothetical protein [Cellulomonadaceae bacterium]
MIKECVRENSSRYLIDPARHERRGGYVWEFAVDKASGDVEQVVWEREPEPACPPLVDWIDPYPDAKPVE